MTEDECSTPGRFQGGASEKVKQQIKEKVKKVNHGAHQRQGTKIKKPQEQGLTRIAQISPPGDRTLDLRG